MAAYAGVCVAGWGLGWGGSRGSAWSNSFEKYAKTLKFGGLAYVIRVCGLLLPMSEPLGEVKRMLKVLNFEI